MTRLRRHPLLALAALSLASVPAAAFAAYESRLSYAACMQDDTGSNVYQDGKNLSTSTTLTVVCPLTDTTDIPHTSLTAMNVHVEDNSSASSVRAFRFVSFFNAVGGASGDSGGSANGVASISPPNTPTTLSNAWSTLANFVGVAVTVPPSTGSPSRLKGYYIFRP